jgi:hypothetical protein
MAALGHMKWVKKSTVPYWYLKKLTKQKYTFENPAVITQKALVTLLIQLISPQTEIYIK